MTKQELRKKYKLLRSKLSESDIDEKSLSISNQLLKLNIWNYEYYHIFLPIVHLKEVNTEFIMHILQGKDKYIVLSKSNFSNGSLSHFLLTDQTKIKLNNWGIPEPEKGIAIAENNIEVVFVPLLCFDKKGNRIGYGKGFYDRFLAISKPKLIIGVSFFEVEENVINETTTFDIPLHYCITPNKVYNFV